MYCFNFETLYESFWQANIMPLFCQGMGGGSAEMPGVVVLTPVPPLPPNIEKRYSGLDIRKRKVNRQVSS